MSIVRYAAISVGLVLAGALAGAIAGVLAGAAVLVLGGGWNDLAGSPELMVLTGAIGAVLGSLLGPLNAWGWLRTVPLGRLFGETTVGAVLGGVVGMFGVIPLLLRLGVLAHLEWVPVFAGVLGFGLAAARLRLATGRRATVIAPSNPAG